MYPNHERSITLLTMTILPFASLVGLIAGDETRDRGRNDWQRIPVFEYDVGPLPCHKEILAASNLVFSPQGEATFVYVVIPECNADREMWLAQHDGEEWHHRFLQANPSTADYQWDILDTIHVDRSNIAVIYEPDGMLRIALAAVGKDGLVILYLKVTPVCACDCPGDLNEDGVLNGLDIQPFIICYLGQTGESLNCDCADVDGDGDIDFDDQTALVQMLLDKVACPAIPDCSDPTGFDIDPVVAVEPRLYIPYKKLAIYLSPDKIPWLIFAASRSPELSTNMASVGLAHRRDGYWQSWVHDEIEGFTTFFDEHEPPLSYFFMSTFSMGPFTNEYPIIGLDPGRIVGLMNIYPELSTDGFSYLVESGWGECDYDGPYGIQISPAGKVVRDNSESEVGVRFCNVEYTVMLDGQRVVMKGLLYSGPMYQIADLPNDEVAFLYHGVDADGDDDGTVRVYRSGHNEFIHAQPPLPSKLRNLAITRGPKGHPLFGDKPVAILFYTVVVDEPPIYEEHHYIDLYYP